MWDRKELKANAKVSLKANYWKAVVASLILFVTSGAFTASSSNKMTDEELSQTVYTEFNQPGVEDMAAIFVGLAAVILVFCIIAMAISIFVWNPLMVGAQRMFVKCKDNSVEYGDVIFGFKNSYLNIIKIEFLKRLFLFLWSCLFIVPGIIKAYEYRMIVYILAENPGISRKEAFAKSKEMMQGNKWNAFVLDLSFIGWHILGVCTLGIVEIFYAAPYNFITDAELYHALKNETKDIQ